MVKNVWNTYTTTNNTVDVTNTINEIFNRLNELDKKDIDKSEKPVVKIKMPKIKNIDFQPPLTVIIWEDGTKTFVKCLENDDFDPEKGAAMAIAKKALGDTYHYNDVINYYVEKYYKKHSKDSSENSTIGKLSNAEADIVWLIRKCGKDAEDFIYDLLIDAYQSM